MSEITRKLASVEIVQEIKSIPDADKICAYRINGWWVVDQKDKYQVGDSVVYLSIDSWSPHSLTPFLSKGKEPRVYNGVEGERVRTIKLRGQLSQGLILPMSVLDEWDSGESILLSGEDTYQEGEDVTEVLGIQKWERPIPTQLQGKVRGNFPSGVRKTDQERVQNLISSLPNLMKNHSFELSEKLDGTSCSCGIIDGEFTVCSRNINLKESDENAYWIIARKHDIESKLRELDLLGYVIQGEIIGPRIQQNKYKVSDLELYVFDVWDINTQTYLTSTERKLLVDQLGLNHVPLVEHPISFTELFGDNPDAFEPNTILQWLLNAAEGKSELNGQTEREGIVLKSIDDPLVSFKAISNKFLLKNNE